MPDVHWHTDTDHAPVHTDGFASSASHMPAETRSYEIYDELKDLVWPTLAKLTAARKQLKSSMEKYKIKKVTSRYGQRYERALADKSKALDSLDEEIKAMGKRQVELLKGQLGWGM